MESVSMNTFGRQMIIACSWCKSNISTGLAGQLHHPDVEAAKQHVLEAVKIRGLVAGIHLVHPDTAVDELKQCVARGYQFIALGTDILFLGDSCRAVHAAAMRLLEHKQ